MNRPERPLVSVVGPVYCEQETIDEFHRRMTAALESIAPPVDHEIVYVNDGSTDGSLERLRALAARDDRVRVADLSRNFGHQVAITCGLDQARGDAVVVTDTDLQDPPEVVADMVARWREGYDVVYGRRETRAGEPPLRLAAIRLAHRVLNWLSDTPLPVDTGDFRLIDRVVHRAVVGMREQNRYVRGMVSWAGFRQTSVDYHRDPRFAGETGYPVGKLIRLAVDGITSFSERPLRIAAQLGLLLTVLDAIYIVYTVVHKIVEPSYVIEGYTSLMAAVLLIGGVQLLCLGLLGEYLGRVFRETKRRPLYLVREVINLDEPAGDATSSRTSST